MTKEKKGTTTISMGGKTNEVYLGKRKGAPDNLNMGGRKGPEKYRHGQK